MTCDLVNERRGSRDGVKTAETNVLLPGEDVTLSGPGRNVAQVVEMRIDAAGLGRLEEWQ